MKKIEEQMKKLKVLDSYINDIPLIVDPCNLCKNKINGTFQIECSECCYYYASKFKIKDNVNEEEKK